MTKAWDSEHHKNYAVWLEPEPSRWLLTAPDCYLTHLRPVSPAAWGLYDQRVNTLNPLLSLNDVVSQAQQCQPQLCSEFKATLGQIRPYLEKHTNLAPVHPILALLNKRSVLCSFSPSLTTASRSGTRVCFLPLKPWKLLYQFRI